jgi:hypothetical protein
MIKTRIVLLAFLFFTVALNAQTAYEHISNAGIYDFLDELANQGHITLNSTVKPYSRQYIAQKLEEASKDKQQMGKTMLQDLEFYKNTYFLELEAKATHSLTRSNKNEKSQLGLNFIAFSGYYRDSLLRFSARPVAGYNYFANADTSLSHRWIGAEAFAYVGNNLGLYANLRDNHESSLITGPNYFSLRPGAPVKNFGTAGVDYSEMRGGVVYSWDWGSLGLIKDHVVWGDNYHGSNILSGRSPSFAHLSFKLKPAKWIELNYIHGWLVSNVIDSSRSYYDDYVYRPVFRNKFIAANLITITPFKKLNISFGNSVIYSDLGVHPAYLIPVFFYKSVDHTLNNTNTLGETGQNSQMFASVSSRQIRKLHLYASAYFDELNVSRIKNGQIHNFFSLKLGARTSSLFLNRLALTGEFTMTKPLTYAHKISTTTFASNYYNLGHYLLDNSKEIYFSAQYKPKRGVTLKLDYTLAKHYNDYLYTNRSNIDGDEPFKDLTWQSNIIGLAAEWEFAANAALFAGLTLSNVKGYDVDGHQAQYYLDKYTPKAFQGEKTSFNAGFRIGF